jgi:uncharacterized tellurite resistance protein B-like protein
MADGVVDSTEHRILEMAKREMELDELPAPVTSLALLATQLNVFDSPMSRNILIMESVAAAMADGEIPESEMNILTQLCECLQIPTEKIVDFRKLAESSNAVYKKAEELIFS